LAVTLLRSIEKYVILEKPDKPHSIKRQKLNLRKKLRALFAGVTDSDRLFKCPLVTTEAGR
jgi:hypothetical protein